MRYFFSWIRVLPGLLLCSHGALFAQIVNIESRRIASDTTGWEGRIDAGFSSAQTGPASFLRANAAAQAQYKSRKNRDLFLLLAQYDIAMGNNRSFVNTGFVHLRYNRKLTKHIRWEAFMQVQYNRLLKLQVRSLMGTGPRFKLTESETLHTYFGALYMYEYEEVAETPFVIHRDHRGSCYLSFNYNANKNITVSSTTYYQPLLRDLRDYRISGNYRVEYKVSKHAALRTELNLLYDTRPPQDVAGFAYTFTSGLTLRL